MKLTSAPALSILAAAMFAVCSGFTPKPSTVVSTVTFGTPQQFSSTCVGRGVCGNTTSSTEDGTRVTFQLLADNPDVLVMTFSVADLKAHQPEQVADFASGSYMFDAAYSLSDPMFASLNLPANSQILPTSQSQVVIDGDVVTDYIVYSHN